MMPLATVSIMLHLAIAAAGLRALRYVEMLANRPRWIATAAGAPLARRCAKLVSIQPRRIEDLPL